MRKKFKLICLLVAVMILSLSMGTISAFADTKENMPQLIAHYEFKDAENLGKDSTANGNNLVKNGNVIQGVHGAYFEGGSSALYAPKGADGKDFSDSIKGNYSVSFWLGHKVNAYIIQTSAWESGFSVASNSTDIFVKPGEKEGEQNVVWAPFENEKWMHVTVVASTTDKKFYYYLNGELKGSADLKGSEFGMESANQVFTLGAQSNPTDNWFANGFTGSLADVRIYTGALTAEQVLAIIDENTQIKIGQDAANNNVKEPEIEEPTEVELIAHYEFKDAENLGKDSTANGNHLLVNGVGVTKGKHGINLNGDGNSMLYAPFKTGTTTDFSDSISGDYSLSFWFVKGIDEGYHYAIQSGWSEDGLSFGQWNGIVVSKAGATVNGVAQNAMDHHEMEKGNWHHVTIVADTTNQMQYLYVDGKLAKSKAPAEGNTTFTMASELGSFAIGGQAAPAYNNFLYSALASFDDVRIYQGALTASQIASIMAESEIVPGSVGANDFEAEEPTEVELIAHYEFKDAENLGKDSTANGNHLAKNGNVIQGVHGAYFEGGSSALYAPKGEDGKDFSDSIKGDYSVSFWLDHKVNAYIIQTSAWESGFSVASNPADLFVKPGEKEAGQNVLNAPFETNKWMHVTVVASTTDKKFYFYLNGELKGSADLIGSEFGMESASQVFTLGAQSNPSDNWFANGFTGSLADVRVYSGALTAEQVLAIIAENTEITIGQDSTNNKIIRDPETDGELIAHYEFKDLTNVGKDSVGNYDLAYVKNSEELTADVDGGVKFTGSQGLYAKEDFSNFINSYTVSLWVKTNNADNPGFILATGGYENKFHFSAAFNNLYIAYGAGGGNTFAVPCTLSTEEYTNVIITASNELGILNVYTNGKLVYSLSNIAGKVGMQEPTFAFALGCQTDENGDSVAANFTGSIKDVRIYNGMVKSATAKSIYENAQINYPTAPSIVTNVNLVSSSDNTPDDMMNAIGTNVTLQVGENTYTAKIAWLNSANGNLRAIITESEQVSLVGKVAVAQMKYVLNLDVVGNGNVLVNGVEYNGQTFAWNEEIEFTVSAPEHYRLVSLYNGAEELTVTDGKSIVVNAGKEIVVSFEAVKYQITLHNGDDTQTLYYDIEKSITLPVLESETVTFVGWFESTTFEGEAIQVISVGSFGNKDLYAKWLSSCIVEYVLNGGVNAENPESIFEGEEVTLAPATKEGHTFAGWYTDAEFINAIETLVYAQAGYTLYAKFNVNILTVTFVVNGGSEIQPLTVEYGSTITLPNDPVKSGFTFDGWYVDEACTELFSSFSALTSDITLYAKYTEEEIYNGQGCKGSMDSSIPALIAIIGLASVVILKKRKG